MTERKVLNKYFPPDFDPAKIPRLKGMKKEKVFSIRTMAPFNMMCLTCRGYIFKAKKFNSRMEECEYTYLDLKEYRFHIRCPTCCSEIVYRTDRENNDYVVESGAKRSFEAYTTAIRQAIKESVQEKEELEKNPIKALEKRTEESMNEFKRSNTIQDLMERSRNDPPREEMIDNTILMLRQRHEEKRQKELQEMRELAERQMEEARQHQQAEAMQQSSTGAMEQLMERYHQLYPDEEAHKLRRANLLQQMIQRKRQLEAEREPGSDAQMTQRQQEADKNIADADDHSLPSATKKCRTESPADNANPLGLDYDSSSADDV